MPRNRLQQVNAKMAQQQRTEEISPQKWKEAGNVETWKAGHLPFACAGTVPGPRTVPFIVAFSYTGLRVGSIFVSLLSTGRICTRDQRLLLPLPASELEECDQRWGSLAQSHK